MWPSWDSHPTTLPCLQAWLKCPALCLILHHRSRWDAQTSLSEFICVPVCLIYIPQVCRGSYGLVLFPMRSQCLRHTGYLTLLTESNRTVSDQPPLMWQQRCKVDSWEQPFSCRYSHLDLHSKVPIRKLNTFLVKKVSKECQFRSASTSGFCCEQVPDTKYLILLE